MQDRKTYSNEKIDRRKQALRNNLRRRKAQLRGVLDEKNEAGEENRATPRIRSLNIAREDDQ